MATKTATAKTAKTQTTESGLNVNTIAFQRGFVVPSKGRTFDKSEAMSVQAELMQLGYVLNQDALNAVTLEWFNDVIPYIKKTLGVGNYRPFYANFPTQVMEMSHSELYWNAILHYWSLGTWEPSYQLKERGFAFEKVKFKEIKLGSQAEFAKIFTTLVSINTSLTANDKAVVDWFVTNQKDNLVMPDSIPFKETLCSLAALGLPVPVKTPTDVLRIATYLSGGDITLPALPKKPKHTNTYKYGRSYRYAQAATSSREAFKFKKFSRADRKYLLSLLERTNLDLGEMKLKLGRWTRLAEILHPGEFEKKFPKTFNAFNVLRNEPQTVKSFYGKVEAAFDKSEAEGLKVLATRPGEFTRRLDYLLRTYNSTTVLNVFKTLAAKTSRKVLWELYNHFLNRGESRPRSVMIKGPKSKRQVLPTLPAMSNVLINKVQSQILQSISGQFAELDKLGKVYLDDKLKKIPLPAAMRSANTGANTYVRGTRIPFGKDAKTIRAYIHWYDENGREDLDLSADFRNEKLQVVGHISYTNLRSDVFRSAHSGDIRFRQGPCAEYVDVDIASALKGGARYVMVQVNNYTGRPLRSVKQCVFGVMEREFPANGEIFVPKTITNAVTVMNESKTACLALLDLKEREFIWCDLESSAFHLATVEANRGNTTNAMAWLLNSEYLSVYDLLLLHIESRGELAVSEEESDVQFKYEDFVTSYEKIASFM